MKVRLSLALVQFDTDFGYAYGNVGAELERRGMPIDLLIVTQTLSRGLTVVTINSREFEQVKNLIIENWVS